MQSGWWPHTTPPLLSLAPRPSTATRSTKCGDWGWWAQDPHGHTGQSAWGHRWNPLPALGARWGQKAGGGRLGEWPCCQCSKLRIPLQSPKAARLLQGNGDRWSLRGGSAEPPRYVVLSTRPPGLVGANSWSQPPCVLGEGGGPFAVPSPQRSRNHSNDMQTPMPATCPWGQQGVEAGGLTKAHRPLLLQAPSSVPDIILATGGLRPPPAPGPSLSLCAAGLPS